MTDGRFREGERGSYAEGFVPDQGMFSLVDFSFPPFYNGEGKSFLYL